KAWVADQYDVVGMSLSLGIFRDERGVTVMSAPPVVHTAGVCCAFPAAWLYPGQSAGVPWSCPRVQTASSAVGNRLTGAGACQPAACLPIDHLAPVGMQDLPRHVGGIIRGEKHIAWCDL